MARHLLDPAIEDEIQALAAEARQAPPLPEDERAELARRLRQHRPCRHRPAGSPHRS